MIDRFSKQPIQSTEVFDQVKKHLERLKTFVPGIDEWTTSKPSMDIKAVDPNFFLPNAVEQTKLDAARIIGSRVQCNRDPQLYQLVDRYLDQLSTIIERLKKLDPDDSLPESFNCSLADAQEFQLALLSLRLRLYVYSTAGDPDGDSDEVVLQKLIDSIASR